MFHDRQFSGSAQAVCRSAGGPGEWGFVVQAKAQRVADDCNGARDTTWRKFRPFLPQATRVSVQTGRITKSTA